MKSKEVKQREAIERKKASLPAAIKRVMELASHAEQHPASAHLKAIADGAEASLARTYREIGLSDAEAKGAARAAALGKPDSWVMPIQQRSTGQEKEAASIEAALRKTFTVVPETRAVCLLPHPTRRAIQVRADGALSDGSLVVNLEILEIDRLASAFRNEGVKVFRNESEYMKYQSGEVA